MEQNASQTKRKVTFANRQESYRYELLSVLFAEGWATLGALIGVFYIEPKYVLGHSPSLVVAWSNTLFIMCIPSCLILISFSALQILRTTFLDSGGVKHRSTFYKQLVGILSLLIVVSTTILAMYFYKNPGSPVVLQQIFFPVAVSISLALGTITMLLYIQIRKKPVWKFPFLT